MKDIQSSLRADNLPKHVAIIMDGNGRWAKERGKPRLWGHHKGVTTAREIVRAAGEIGIEVLTLFAFSEENWSRPRLEVDGIMKLIDRYVVKERAELNRNNVQLSTIGELRDIPVSTRRRIRETEEFLKDNTGLKLNIALSYGSRSEITRACRRLAAKVAAGELAPDEITKEMISGELDTAQLPDPDLLIRTSGEERISNFLLWQIAYTELLFTKTYWPAFSKEEFVSALIQYQNRQRRYGLTGEQMVRQVSGVLPPFTKVAARGETI